MATKSLSLGEILTSQVITLPPDSQVSHALDKMREKKISAIVIVQDSKPIGIFTERDAVMMVFNNENISHILLKDVMTTHLISAAATMDYREAYRMIKSHNFRHLVVVDEQKNLLGILSESNFLDHLGNEFLVRYKEVGSLMTQTVITLPVDASIKDAIQLMAHNRISCIVLESKGLPKGIFTERDLIKLDNHSPGLLAKPIRNIMSSPVKTILKEESLPNAIEKMERSGIRRLVVVDDQNNIIGLITRSDIVKQLYDRHIEHLQNIIRDREEELKLTQKQLSIMNELIQTQQLLEEKQIELELALDAGKIFTWKLYARDKLIFSDSRMAQVFDLDTAQIEKGIPLELFIAIIDEQDHELIYKSIEHSIKTGENFRVDFRISKGDEVKYFKARGKASKNKANEILSLIGIIADVTGDTKHLLSYKKSQQQLLQAQRIARMGNWELDAKTLKAFWSDDLHKLLGTTAEMDVGLGLLESYVHKADWSALKKSIESAIFDDKKHEVEYRVQAADGSTHWVYCKAKNIKDHSGKVKKLSGILQDITERKYKDEKIRLSTAVFENSLEGILITDIDGNIVDVNPAFSDITGYSYEDVIGQNTRIFKSGHHDEKFYAQIWQSLNDFGQWRGEIWNRRRDGSVFPEWENISSVFDDQGNRTHYVSVFSDISQIKNTQIKLDYLAHHDALTDLPNRLLLNERLNQAIRHAKRLSSKMAIFFLDLDNFKHINDSLGHPTGDSLLKAVTAKLLETVRQDDTVARIGGDEFVLLLEDISRPENAILMADKLLAIFQHSFDLKDHQIGITASMGICLYPEDGEDTETLMRNADSAMYLAKTEGRNTYQFYTKELTRNAFERVLLENNLRKAIDNKEFLLHFQPQYNLTDLKIIGFEALIRWNHPDLGILSPVKFIPIAEDSGLIIPIGKWVLTEACLVAKQWLDSGYDFGRIAVNIAGPQLQRGNLINDVNEALKLSGLAANYLELEITEGFIMQQAKDAIQQLNELRIMGITISIDDFGTGYSSLSYLKQLPVQKIKIDQSFIRDIPDDTNDMAIADAIIAMGKSLGLIVIAEGVETQQQADFLKQFGCQEAQGFLYNKPLSIEEIHKQFI